VSGAEEQCISQASEVSGGTCACCESRGRPVGELGKPGTLSDVGSGPVAPGESHHCWNDPLARRQNTRITGIGSVRNRHLLLDECTGHAPVLVGAPLKATVQLPEFVRPRADLLFRSLPLIAIVSVSRPDGKE